MTNSGAGADSLRRAGVAAAGAGPPGGETYRAVDQHLERDEDRSQDGELQWYAAEAAAHAIRRAHAGRRRTVTA